MPNIESDTLYEKLDLINKSKEDIKKAIIQSGGGDHINDDTLFEEYGDSIRKTFSDVQRVINSLNYIEFGIPASNTTTPTYSNTLQYIVDLQGLKSMMVTNLNLKGAQVSDSDSLQTLVEEILKL